MLHTDRRQLLNDGDDVHLTPKAFDLLALLVAQRPAVVAKADIHKQLWPNTFVSDATLVGLVKELRRALDDHDGLLIRTAHRVGYAFAASDERERDRTTSTRSWLVAGTRRFALQPPLPSSDKMRYGPTVAPGVRAMETEVGELYGHWVRASNRLKFASPHRHFENLVS